VHELLRANYVAAVQGHPDADRGEDRDDLLGEVQRTEQREAEDRRQRKLPSRRIRLPRDLPLEDSVDDEVLQAPRELIPAPLPALAREEEPEAVIHLPAEDSEAHG